MIEENKKKILELEDKIIDVDRDNLLLKSQLDDLSLMTANITRNYTQD